MLVVEEETSTIAQEVLDMANEFEVTVRVHKETLLNALQKRIDDFTKESLNDDIKLRAAEIFADCIEPLVPKDQGGLRANISFPKYRGTRAVQYDSKYAEAQYRGFNGRGVIRNYTTPGTIDHWNLHLSRADREAFYDLVAEEIITRLNNG